MIRIVVLVSITLLVSQFALAQQAVTQGQVQAVAPVTTSNFKPVAGLKSTNDSGRIRQLDNAKDLRVKSKQEFYVGFQHTSGWGLQGQVVEKTKNYGDTAKNKFSAGDPSITIAHPDLFNDGTTKISGKFREYFPVSDNAVNRNQYQQAYYLYLNAKLGVGDLKNELIPRYNSQSRYEKADTVFYTEDTTTLSRTANSWLRYGVSQWTQVENHFATATGLTTEIIPYADITVGKNLFFGPRVYLPVVAKDIVNDGPTTVSTGNIMFEFYLQATL